MKNTFYFKDTELPDESKLFSLFLTTGWNESYKLEKSEMFTAVKNSWYYVSACDKEKLIGFGRILCDGIVHALILDLIVHPDYQNQGIGKTILNKLVDKCRQHRIRDIQLYSVKGKDGFYRKMGFKERPEGEPGMEIKLFQ
ncbi:MAG: GNAT family N-acetyltransferase [Bacteroidales bacterium]|nr:GNAT family N-acetyltransferase [Bacteroidales bacterium]MCF8404902.1 GNAT family N-acetyltransferase [Bacteroidales bacterium]